MERIDTQLTVSNVCEHRKEECIHYAGCLEEASALLWPSFSCKNCKQYSVGAKPVFSYERNASPTAWEV